MLRRGWIPTWLFHMQECPNLGNVPVKCKIKALFWRLIHADKSLWLLTNNYKRSSDKGGILEDRNSQVCSCLTPFGRFFPALEINSSDVPVFCTSLIASSIVKPPGILRCVMQKRDRSLPTL